VANVLSVFHFSVNVRPVEQTVSGYRKHSTNIVPYTLLCYIIYLEVDNGGYWWPYKRVLKNFAVRKCYVLE